MTRDEIIEQASKLDLESGYYGVANKGSPEQVLSPVKLNLHRAASYLWVAASKMETACPVKTGTTSQ